MQIRQFPVEGLGHLSTLIADDTTAIERSPAAAD
jgi:hypothetical protein